MALLLKKIYHGYFYIFDELSDPRATGLFSSPVVILPVILGYIYLVKNLGPKLMENRKPFEIKKFILIYNIVQIILNAIISYRSILQLMKNNLSCRPIDYTNSEDGLEQLSIAHFYLCLKLLDLVDTVCFVLRKSYRQISFLHVYHHAGMVGGIWLGYKFFGGGEGIYVPAINGIVHVLMFAYYTLAAWDSTWKNSLTLKKALTQIQLIQFMFFLYNFGIILITPECTYPKLVSYLFVPQNFFMIILFGDFYLKTYVFRKNKTE